MKLFIVELKYHWHFLDIDMHVHFVVMASSRLQAAAIVKDEEIKPEDTFIMVNAIEVDGQYVSISAGRKESWIDRFYVTIEDGHRAFMKFEVNTDK